MKTSVEFATHFKTWNLTMKPFYSIGCEKCTCNLDYAIGGTCDQETGQCQCMEGVVGKNCDRCPVNWVLVVNDNRAIRPKWKEPFDYEEGCFPCSTCVSDLMGTANQLSDSLAPVLEVFGGVNSSYLVRTTHHIFSRILSCLFLIVFSRIFFFSFW